MNKQVQNYVDFPEEEFEEQFEDIPSGNIRNMNAEFESMKSKSSPANHVYKITIKTTDGDKYYIGSTKLGIRNRMMGHKAKFISFANDASLYKLILDNGGWENVSSEVIETVTETINDHSMLHSLRIREGVHINQLRENGKPIINKNKPHVDDPNYSRNYNRKWRVKNPHYFKAYYKKNRAKILARNRIKVPCPVCGKHVRKSYLANHLTTQRCRSNAL